MLINGRSPYEILGVRPQDSEEVVKKRYRELARKLHPDASGGATAGEFSDINNAYNFLKDNGLFGIKEQRWVFRSLFDIVKGDF